MKYSKDLKLMVVNLHKSQEFSYRRLESLCKIPKSNIQRWVKKYTVINKTIKKKDNNNKILQFLKNSLSQNPFKRLRDLKYKIHKKFKVNLSIMTISKYLKRCGLSKKKVSIKNYNKDLKQHKIKKKEFIKMIKKINKDDIICIDETYVNQKIYSNYGWSKINTKLNKFRKITSLRKKSIMMAISNSRILDHEVINESYNAGKFEKYITNLIKNNNLTNKYILMDNVGFHKGKNIMELIKKSNNVIFIPPYSPEFNPVEELFSVLKSRIKNNLTVQKLGKNIDTFIGKFKKEVNNTNLLSKYYKRSFNII